MYLQEIGSGAWENVKSIFSNIASGLGNIFKTPINFIIGAINTFIRGLNKIKIPDWVPGVGGFGIHIKEIPKLKVGIDYVPKDDFPAILHKGERVLTKEENTQYNKNLQKPAEETKRSKENTNKDNSIQLTIKIDKFINNTKEDIQELGEELAFILKKKLAAKGGSY